MRFFQGKPLDDYGFSAEDEELYNSALDSITQSSTGGDPVLSPQSLD
jgi:hypothetical protein